MATTFFQPGHTRNVTNTGTTTLASNTLVVLRAGASGEVGVVHRDIAAGNTGVMLVSGVHALTAATGAISQHAVVYRDASTGAITTTSTLNTYAGVAVAAKTTAATVAYVLLNNRPGPRESQATQDWY